MTTDTEARELLSQLTRFTPGPWRNADGTIQSKAKVTHPDGTVEWTYKYARNIAHVVEDSDYIVNGNIIAAAPDMHRLLTALLDENERLRRLDEQYGRVEEAIIFADPEFDGNSAHADCGDRLVASVQRLALRAEKAEAERAAAWNDAIEAAAKAYAEHQCVQLERWEDVPTSLRHSILRAILALRK